MKLYPQDLDGERHLQVLERRKPPRKPARVAAPAGTAAQPRPGRLSRFWTGALVVEEQAARRACQVLELDRPVRQGIGLCAALGLLLALTGLALRTGGLPLETVLLLWYGAVFLLAGFLYSLLLLPRARFHQMHRPLAPEEINELLEETDDALQREFLELAQTVLQVPAPREPAVENTFRQAMRALAVALASIPRPDPTLAEDPAALVAKAARLTGQAQNEADAIVQASVERRAGTLRDRIPALELAAARRRRIQVLRDEIRSQMAVQRAHLQALTIGDGRSLRALSQVAAGLEQVATLAGARLDAEAEVEQVLPQRLLAGIPAPDHALPGEPDRGRRRP